MNISQDWRSSDIRAALLAKMPESERKRRRMEDNNNNNNTISTV
jgi:hypothetical protein